MSTMRWSAPRPMRRQAIEAIQDSATGQEDEREDGNHTNGRRSLEKPRTAGISNKLQLSSQAALAIFNTLSEFIAEKMAAHHGMLLDVFRSSLQAQQELSVRNAALRALASFLMALSEPSQRVPFQELVPLMLQTISDALARGMEDECREALEVFVEVAESQTKFLKRHLAECVTGALAPPLTL